MAASGTVGTSELADVAEVAEPVEVVELVAELAELVELVEMVELVELVELVEVAGSSACSTKFPPVQPLPPLYCPLPIITARVCVVPSARLPVARAPAAGFPVTRKPLIIRFIFVPSIGRVVVVVLVLITRIPLSPNVRPVFAVVVLVPTMNPSVAVVTTLSRVGLLGCVGFVDGPGDNTPVSLSSCSVEGPGHGHTCFTHRMPEVAPIAVGTHLVVGNPPTQGLSQLLVPCTTMFGSLGGRSQYSLQRSILRLLLDFHLVEKTVEHHLWLNSLIQFLLSTSLDSHALPHVLVRNKDGSTIRNSDPHQAFHLSRFRKRPRCAVVRATIRFQFHVRIRSHVDQQQRLSLS